MWKSGGSSPVHGQTVVKIEDVTKDDTDDEVVPEYPVSVKIQMETGARDHDFVKTRHCKVGGQLILSSLVEKQVLLEYNLREQIKGARITGNTGQVMVAKCDYLTIYNLCSLFLRWICYT